jgi:hypothetical protein
LLRLELMSAPLASSGICMQRPDYDGNPWSIDGQRTDTITTTTTSAHPAAQVAACHALQVVESPTHPPSPMCRTTSSPSAVGIIHSNSSAATATTGEMESYQHTNIDVATMDREELQVSFNASMAGRLGPTARCMEPWWVLTRNAGSGHPRIYAPQS